MSHGQLSTNLDRFGFLTNVSSQTGNSLGSLSVKPIPNNKDDYDDDDNDDNDDDDYGDDDDDQKRRKSQILNSCPASLFIDLTCSPIIAHIEKRNFLFANTL